MRSRLIKTSENEKKTARNEFLHGYMESPGDAIKAVPWCVESFVHHRKPLQTPPPIHFADLL